MKGDLYDARGRFIGREGGFTNADPLGRQLAAANSQHSSGGGTFTEEQNQARQGNAPAGGTPPQGGQPPAAAPQSDYVSTAGDQLSALGNQQQINWAAQDQARDNQAFANVGAGRSGSEFRQASWMGNPPSNINMQSLAATNPNVLNDQNSAANQFAALDRAQANMPANQRSDRVTVQGVNGPTEYVRNSVTGQVTPAPGSVAAITVANATGMPSVNVGPPMKI